MSNAINNLLAALHKGIAGRPDVGGFPYLAEALREAGVKENEWQLPACQCLYLTDKGPVMMQGTPLITGMAEVPPFDKQALIYALRADQAGKKTFPEFLKATWEAGIVRYIVDFDTRKVTYYGGAGESYTEDYPRVSLKF